MLICAHTQSLKLDLVSWVRACSLQFGSRVVWSAEQKAWCVLGQKLPEPIRTSHVCLNLNTASSDSDTTRCADRLQKGPPNFGCTPWPLDGSGARWRWWWVAWNFLNMEYTIEKHVKYMVQPYVLSGHGFIAKVIAAIAQLVLGPAFVSGRWTLVLQNSFVEEWHAMDRPTPDILKFLCSSIQGGGTFTWSKHWGMNSLSSQ